MDELIKRSRGLRAKFLTDPSFMPAFMSNGAVALAR